MKIKTLIKNCCDEIGNRPDALLAVELILCYILGITKEKLFLSHEEEVTDSNVQIICSLVSRIVRGEPVAYVIGQKEFYNLTFFVDKRVLIPRPETELLVDQVIRFCKNGRKSELKWKIVDVGTGCGNIALTLAENIEHAYIDACDVSTEALMIARANADRLGLIDRVRFFQSDLLSKAEMDYDVVVANLPYIGTESFNFVSRETREFEPAVALFGGSNGLGLYEKLFTQVASWKRKPALLLGEFGFLQGDLIRILLEKYLPGGKVIFLNDYASIERVFMVSFAGE
jgi:release factor glutamine methyltransferase